MDVPRREGEAQREDTVADVSPDAAAQPSAASIALGPGDVVADKFVVERVIGLGGMAQVLAARHLKLGTRVAIKAVHPTLATDPQAVARFLREAQAMASLESEHVVRVHDVGELPNGVPYLIMDYLEGRDLGAMLAERGPLPVPLALEYIRQACDALIEAHAVGIIHRDMKPQNVFVVRKPSGAESVRVLDFGLAKAVTAEDGHQLTKAGHIMGTAYYMAPEQLYAAGNIDARTDVWSTGATLFRLLTRQYPFQESNAALAAVAILKRDASPIKSVRPDIPDAVAAIVDRCLTKDPARRFQSMSELTAAIDHARSTLLLAPPTPSQPFVPVSIHQSIPVSAPRSAPRSAPPTIVARPSSSNAALWASVALLGCLLVGGAITSIVLAKRKPGTSLVAPAAASPLAKGESAR